MSQSSSLAKWYDSLDGALLALAAEVVNQIFRDMFSDFDELRPLLAAADILAHTTDWPELYDERILAKNEVPVYASLYTEDMYVHFDFARDTASKLSNCKTFITNVMYHDALSRKTDELLKQLFALRDDTID